MKVTRLALTSDGLGMKVSTEGGAARTRCREAFSGKCFPRTSEERSEEERGIPPQVRRLKYLTGDVSSAD